MPGIKFGVEPNMREVPPGEHAVIKLGKMNEWKEVETEWGQKYSFPITVFSHPSYDSIPKAGLQMNWESKSVAAQSLWNWIYTKGEINTFDFDIEKEVYVKWKLSRHESGGYFLDQL
jgi:hypothetical protein